MSTFSVICNGWGLLDVHQRSASCCYFTYLLEKCDQFCAFLLNEQSQGRELRLYDFLIRPLRRLNLAVRSWHQRALLRYLKKRISKYILCKMYCMLSRKARVCTRTLSNCFKSAGHVHL
jgi:hypothetical protein